MFCCVLKSSLPATSFPARTFRGNILSEKYERHLIFHAGSGDGTAWQGAWEKWLDRKNTGLLLQWISQESWHWFPNWIKIRKPWDFCTAQRWQKKEFPGLKGWLYQYSVAQCWIGPILDRAQIKVPHLKILQGWRKTRVVWWWFEMCLAKTSISITHRSYQKGSAAQ